MSRELLKNSKRDGLSQGVNSHKTSRKLPTQKITEQYGPKPLGGSQRTCNPPVHYFQLGLIYTGHVGLKKPGTEKKQTSKSNDPRLWFGCIEPKRNWAGTQVVPKKNRHPGQHGISQKQQKKAPEGKQGGRNDEKAVSYHGEKTTGR